MRKVLVLALVMVGVFGMSGCEVVEDGIFQERLDEMEARFDEISMDDGENYYTMEEIDEMFEVLAPTQVDRFLDSMLEAAISEGSGFEFVEVDRVYTGIVDAYGFSGTYVFEALEPITLLVSVQVGNDLEFCYYENGLMGEAVCNDLRPDTVFNNGLYEFEVEVEGFFVFEFESWDEDEDSEFTIVIQEVE